MRFGDDEAGVDVRIADGVADVRLDRPEKLNALNATMFAAIAEAIDALGTSEDVRCVVLSGNGRSFCAGIDLAMLAAGVGSLSPRTRGLANDLQFCTWGWRELPVPVIAALHGHVYGAGFQIALGADIRIAAPDAKLSLMEMRHGISPDLGAFALARGVIREDVFRELAYTARTFDGREGQPLGVVTRICEDPLAEAMTLALEIASKAPDGIRSVKRLAGMMHDATDAQILQAESNSAEPLIAARIREMKG